MIGKRKRSRIEEGEELEYNENQIQGRNNSGRWKHYHKRKYNLSTDVDPDPNALKYKKDVMAHSIANCVHEYTDIFLLSLFSTPKIISIYSVYNLFLNGVRKVQTMFTNGLEGAFGETWASGKI